MLIYKFRRGAGAGSDCKRDACQFDSRSRMRLRGLYYFYLLESQCFVLIQEGTKTKHCDYTSHLTYKISNIRKSGKWKMKYYLSSLCLLCGIQRETKKYSNCFLT